MKTWQLPLPSLGIYRFINGHYFYFKTPDPEGGLTALSVTILCWNSRSLVEVLSLSYSALLDNRQVIAQNVGND